MLRVLNVSFAVTDKREACAGELSNDPSVLKNSLGQILHLASHWKAVLLLDEADVFLEQRSLGMHIANSLISVFLRMLEYFEGIMFLTTNRLTVFDEAILSRIHLALRFNNLDKSARESVWHHFLAMAEESHEVASITQRELTVLIDKKLNGRQVCNDDLWVTRVLTSSIPDQERRTSRACLGQGREHPTRLLSIGRSFGRHGGISGGFPRPCCSGELEELSVV